MKKLLILVAILMLIGGSALLVYAIFFRSAQTPANTPAQPSQVSASIAPNQNKNPLTGLNTLPDSAVGKSPVAIMVSNSKSSLPQAGIDNADMVYETVTEGGITRLLTLFADANSVPLTGPVRSVRDYFIDLAAPFKPIFVHYGGSDTGYQALQKSKLPEIDGMVSPDAFYQNQSLAQSRGKEHSYFASSETLQGKISNLSSSVSVPDAFHFSEETLETTLPAASVHVPFSTSYQTDFQYDATSQKYLKNQFSSAQVDSNTKQQVAINNLFVLYADITGASDGSERRSIDLSSGMGLYCSKGNASHIMWSKDDLNLPFHFLSEEGDELKVLPGNSWVCIIPSELQNSVTFS